MLLEEEIRRARDSNVKYLVIEAAVLIEVNCGNANLKFSCR